MPQELRVVRCFSCETFQVDIVKKIPKWTCKMCGEKQSLKKVYGQGTGKDCRLIVQNLNQQHISLQNQVLENPTDTENKHFTNGNDIKRDVGEQQGTNKWSEFLVEDVKNEAGEEGLSDIMFECQRNKKQKVNDYVHQNITKKEVNDNKMYIVQHSECNDDEIENVSQNRIHGILATKTSNSKWKEFCSQESEDKNTKQVLTTENLTSKTKKCSVMNIFADEDIDFDAALDF